MDVTKCVLNFVPNHKSPTSVAIALFGNVPNFSGRVPNFLQADNKKGLG